MGASPRGIAFGPLRVAFGVEASLVTAQSQVGDVTSSYPYVVRLLNRL
jgi:hypothetical protein